MANQVTQLTQGKVPLGETSIDFYESLPAVLNHSGTTDVPSTTIKSSSSMPSTPSIMSKVSKIISSASSTVLNSQNTTTLQWSCAKCTFLNHPCLQLCEQCEMPRFPEMNNSKECICHDDTTTTTTNNSTNNCANHAAIIQ